jgi:tRNA dimethylallyltransferase
MQILEHVRVFLSTTTKPLLALVGPTASGKTALSITLAKHIPGIEVINADSRQLYTHLNIGTAKITTAEMQDVPHHLLDVLDPKESVSVGWYKRAACKKIDELHANGAVPLLVGGSMLYIDAVTKNFTLPVPTDPAVRIALQKRLDTEGIDVLYEELQQLDPVTAAGIPKQNIQHVLRNLELCLQTGSTKVHNLNGGMLPPMYDVCTFGVLTERDQLVQRIHTRTERMFEQGWLDEVEHLLDVGYTADDPGMMSHGYRECIDFLINQHCTLSQLKASIAKQTRAYAKRQTTWWRRDITIRWL